MKLDPEKYAELLGALRLKAQKVQAIVEDDARSLVKEFLAIEEEDVVQDKMARLIVETARLLIEESDPDWRIGIRTRAFLGDEEEE